MTPFLLLAVLVLAQAGDGGHHGGHHGFGDAERWIRVFEDPARAEWQQPEAVVEMLALEPGMRVADVGAGTGYFSRRFAARVGAEGEALALDLEPELLEYAARKAEEEGLSAHRTRVPSADDPGLEAEAWDRVFMCDVLHHIEPRVPYLEKLAAALKPGGWLVIVDFHHDRDLPVGPPKAMRIDKAALQGELEALGFEVELVEELPYQYVLIARKPSAG